LSVPDPQGAVAPEALEAAVSGVVSQVLGRPIARGANFLEARENTYDSVRVYMQLRKRLNLDVRLVDVFIHPTVASLAHYLKTVQPRPKVNEEQLSGFAYLEVNQLFRALVRRSDIPLKPSYVWGATQAAYLATMLRYPRISFLEFGVAGGRGLLALQRIAELLSEELHLGIEVYGFDTGRGLPKPQDWRDVPQQWWEGEFPMDVRKLERQLRGAKLVLGLIQDTLPVFMARGPAPVAFVSIDVDLYSSAHDALNLLEAKASLLLPRVHFYFDDIMGLTVSDINGERLAIHEFNESHELRKLGFIYGLRHWAPVEHREDMWTDQFFLAHILDHPKYGEYDGLIRIDDLNI